MTLWQRVRPGSARTWKLYSLCHSTSSGEDRSRCSKKPCGSPPTPWSTPVFRSVPRDPGSVAALPGDVYSLAPASSRQLGEEVWTAHLTWGATKARAMRRTRLVGLLSGNLMDRSRIGPLVERSGAQLVVWTNYAAGTADTDGDLPDLVVADLAVPDSLRAIDRWVQAGVRVIAYGPHVDRQALQSARLAGAEQVLARSVFFDKLGDLLS